MSRLDPKAGLCPTQPFLMMPQDTSHPQGDSWTANRGGSPSIPVLDRPSARWRGHTGALAGFQGSYF